MIVLLCCMITDKGKKILKGIIAEEGIKLSVLAKKRGVRPEEFSRILNPPSKNQEKALKVLIAEIEKARPDINIQKILKA